MNVRGFNSKFDSIVDTLINLDIHIAIVNETWFKDKIPCIDDYVLFCKSRQNGRGGGVAIALRKSSNLEGEVLDTSEQNSISEWLFLKVNLNKHCIYIMNVYGPQENASLKQVEEFYNNISLCICRHTDFNDQIILAGDLNAKLNVSRNGKILSSVLKTINLGDICPPGATHADHKSESKLDYVLARNILTRDEEIIKNKLLIPRHIDLLNSTNDKKAYVYTDHWPVKWTIVVRNSHTVQYEKQNRETKKSLVYKKICDSKLVDKYLVRDIIQSFEYDFSISSLANYDKWFKMVKRLDECLFKAKYVDSNLRKKNKSFIMINEVKEVINELRDIRKQLKVNSFKEGQSRFMVVGKERALTLTLSQMRYQHFKRIRQEFSQKLMLSLTNGRMCSDKLWENVRAINNGSRVQYDYLDEKGEKVTDKEGTFSLLTKHYSDLYKVRESTSTEQLNFDKMLQDFVAKVNSYVSDGPPLCENRDVIRALRSLKTKKSRGSDGLSSEALKLLLFEDISQTTTLFNKLLSENKVPSSWKCGILTSIYKGKGIKGNPTNERGITVTCAPFKLMEKLIYSHMLPFVKISERQAGGRVSMGTGHHIFLIDTLIMNAKRDKKYMVITFLDVEKAFDKASFKSIIFTLEKLGCPKHLIKYMNELNNGAKVKIKTKFGFSDPFETGQTLKQGAVLSPIQFGALIDEIGNLTKIDEDTPFVGTSPIPNVMFVDDIANSAYSRKKTNEDLKTIFLNALLRLMKFGHSKSNYIEICKHLCVEDCDIMLGEDILEQVASYKYLGVMENDKGDLSDHINMIQKKAIVVTAQINKLVANNEFSINSSAVALRLVKSMLIPVICYGLEYRVFKQVEIDKINRIFIQSIKCIWSLKKQTSNWVCLKELDLFPIDIIVDARRLIFLTTDVVRSKLLQDAFFSNKYWTNELLRLKQKFDVNEMNENDEGTAPTKAKIKNLINSKRNFAANCKLAKETKFSDTMKNLVIEDSKCERCKISTEPTEINNFCSQYNLKSKSIADADHSSTQAVQHESDAMGNSGKSSIYNAAHCNYTDLLQIGKVRNLILARSNALIRRDFRSSDKNEAPCCVLCMNGPLTLEHLLDNCTVIESKVDGLNCSYSDLFRCGDQDDWNRRERKVDLIAKCLYATRIS